MCLCVGSDLCIRLNQHIQLNWTSVSVVALSFCRGMLSRSQEEMCRQFYDGYGMRIVVLRPSGIIDVPQRLFRDRRVLSKVWGNSSVSRHHLGQAACAALKEGTADFAVLHAVTIPDPPLTDYDPRKCVNLIPSSYPPSICCITEFLLNCDVCMRRRFSNVGKAPEWLAGFDFTLDVRKYGYVGTEAEEKVEPVAKL